ncbi:MAG: hypothetical protein U1E65_00280 [Myxococcota bacterium]
MRLHIDQAPRALHRADVQVHLLDVSVSSDLSGLAIGLAVGRGVSIGPSSAAEEAALAAELSRTKARQDLEARTKEVRDLLRFGAYKPTGRGKPASEYLLAAAREDRFPKIHNLVDALNRISLHALLPISVLDLDRAQSQAFSIRRGRPGESYVFNTGGQSIDLGDLLLVSILPEDRATANAVKDSMATKLEPGSTNVLAVVYAPLGRGAEAGEAAAALAQAFREEGGAKQASHAVLTV